MPQQPIDYGAILRRLRPQGQPDSYVSRRTDEIYSGIDDMVPDVDSADIRAAQDESGGRYSRDSIRSGGMALLRQKIGQSNLTHNQTMQRENQRGQFQVEAQERAAAAAADRARIAQESIMDRQDATQRAIDARQERTLAGQQSRLDDTQDFKAANPTANRGVIPGGMYDAVSKAEADLPGNPISKFLYGQSANDKYERALSNLLDRKGLRQDADEIAAALQKYQGTIEERIAASQSDPDYDGDIAAWEGMNDADIRKYLALKVR